MIIREATLEDFRAFYGRKPPRTVKALCAEDETGIRGIGGFYFDNGKAVMFTDHDKPFTKREVVQCGRAMMKLAKGITVPLIAIEGEEFGTTAMKHFGFRARHDFWQKEE